jgi:hypothetical protein
VSCLSLLRLSPHRCCPSDDAAATATAAATAAGPLGGVDVAPVAHPTESCCLPRAQNNKKPIDVITTLKPKYQAVMHLIFAAPREEVAAIADSFARGEGTMAIATGTSGNGGDFDGTVTMGGDAGGEAAPAPAEFGTTPFATTSPDKDMRGELSKTFSPKKRK